MNNISLQQIFFFGNGLYGQSTIFSDENYLIPHNIKFSFPIRSIYGGGNHAGAISDDALLYTWGDNVYYQLGRQELRKPNIVPALETLSSIQCSLSEKHSAVITLDGKLITFGCNESGVLGTNNNDSSPKRIIIKDCNNFFTFVSCGKDFTYTICNNGNIYSWGKNWNGQLGMGDFLPIVIPENNISILNTQPIIEISCGKSHVLFLNISGNLFSCGSNNFGELGLGDKKSRPRPTFIETSLHIPFCKICVGDSHNLALTNNGTIYSWGMNSYGQLGHGDLESVLIPKRINELSNKFIISIATGSRHSLAIQKINNNTNNIIYSWGFSGSGQLGHGNTKTIVLPTIIEYLKDYNPIKISCGYEFSFVICNNNENNENNNNNIYNQSKNLLSFQNNEIPNWNSNNIKDLYQKIKVIFSSAACLNASFLDIDINSPNYHYNISNEYSGVNMKYVRDSFKGLVNIYQIHPQILTVLANSTGKLVNSLQSLVFNSPIALRVFLILLEVPWMLQPDKYHIVLEKLIRSILGLSSQFKQILVSWWSNLEYEYISRIQNVCTSFLSFLLSNNSLDNSIISSVVLVLDLIYDSNKNNKLLSDESFTQPLISSRINLLQDFQNWCSQSNRVFAFCHYPYLLDINAKKILLRIEASIIMRLQVQRAFIQHKEPIFHLKIHRTRILNDVITELINYISEIPEFDCNDLKRPLQVEFFGEDGVDEGGLKRELFYLLTEQLFNPKLGLFTIIPESFYYWFPSNFNSNSNIFTINNIEYNKNIGYKLIGMIIGMAIYNGVILNIQFPSILYKLLFEKDITLKDISKFKPSLANGLEQLLKMNKEDLEETNLTFEILIDNGITYELRPNGKDIPVTIDNISLYIQLYINYITFISIQDAFIPFKEGFWLICNGKVMKLLNPLELEVLICGTVKIDFNQLKNNTEYINGYTKDSKIIQWFWEIVNDFSYKQKSNFLLFTTGTPRVPITGIQKFIIQKSGPHSDRLPVAHTCFNTLDIPEYKSKEYFREKLLKAIENFQGFGLV